MTIFDEMSRQAEDARQSFARNGEVADEIAEAARTSGRLILLGMGGSHAVNRVAEVALPGGRHRRDGDVVSEALHAPIPTRGATVLLTSQSGDSGEIVAYLKREATGEDALRADAQSGRARWREVGSVARRAWRHRSRPLRRREASM